MSVGFSASTSFDRRRANMRFNSLERKSCSLPQRGRVDRYNTQRSLSTWRRCAQVSAAKSIPLHLEQSRAKLIRLFGVRRVLFLRIFEHTSIRVQIMHSKLCPRPHASYLSARARLVFITFVCITVISIFARTCSFALNKSSRAIRTILWPLKANHCWRERCRRNALQSIESDRKTSSELS